MNPTTVRELEAEIDRLRAELANVHHNAEMWYAEKLRHEATIARVRGLHGPSHPGDYPRCKECGGWSDAEWWPCRTIHTLDGGTE